MKAIANLKKAFLIQVVVVWKHCTECPGDGCTWRKLPKKLTHLVSQTKCGKFRNFSNDNIDAYERLWSIILHIHTDKELTKLSLQSVS